MWCSFNCASLHYGRVYYAVITGARNPHVVGLVGPASVPVGSTLNGGICPLLVHTFYQRVVRHNAKGRARNVRTQKASLPNRPLGCVIKALYACDFHLLALTTVRSLSVLSVSIGLLYPMNAEPKQTGLPSALSGTLGTYTAPLGYPSPAAPIAPAAPAHSCAISTTHR